jgi:hypothetical protein
MRQAIVLADMPAPRNAQAVTATPPAPAAASRRMAAIPASGISMLARQLIRGMSRPKTVLKRTAYPPTDSSSSRAPSASQRGSPCLSSPQVWFRPASLGTRK